MIFSTDNFTIKARESEQNILKFQNEKGLLFPPSFLYLLFNFGEIKYNYHKKYYYTDEYYDGILIDTIPNIVTLCFWLDNYWDNLLRTNKNLNYNYLPILGTYAPNIMFLVGINDSNLDKIYLYDDDYVDFKPLLISGNIFELFTQKIKIE